MNNCREKVRKYKIQNENLNTKEQFVLKLSMYMALLLAVFGILFGVISKTQAIIFDGFVAFVSVGLGYLSVITSKYIYKDDDDIFQYGYVRFELMINLFKSLILLIVCVYAFISALSGVIKGGYDIYWVLLLFIVFLLLLFHLLCFLSQGIFIEY